MRDKNRIDSNPARMFTGVVVFLMALGIAVVSISIVAMFALFCPRPL